MFFATQGDAGPRVVLVQALLRLKAVDVRVTGSWDAQTGRAVGEYRARLGLAPRGPVDGTVFFELVQGTRLKVVNSIDERAGAPGEATQREMKDAGMKPLLNAKTRNSVGRCVHAIVERAQNHRIGLLRIYGHGNRGTWISIAVGDPVKALEEGRWSDYEAMRADRRGYIALPHFDELRPVLAELKPWFAPYGSAEIYACKIGRQEQLLQKLANTWNVPVTGSYANVGSGGVVRNQFGEQVPVAFTLLGPLRTAYPHMLDLATWAGQVDKKLVDLPKLAGQVRSGLEAVIPAPLRPRR